MPDRKQIGNAVNWSRKQKPTIEQAMPIEVPGRTFAAPWLTTLEKYIGLYEADKLSDHLGRAYIQYPLRAIKEAVSIEV